MSSSNAVATVAADRGAIMESVIIKGDLSRLTPEERSHYYGAVCKSVGLNPLTKPFEFITLNGKLTLYAKRDATDQLRSIHGISVSEMTENERDGVFIVTVQVRNAEGRTDMAKGAVNIANLKGEALANAMMKCETKAKRRATLSICGLGFLDETEVETVPTAQPTPQATGKRTREQISADASWKREQMAMVQKELAQITSIPQLERYKREVLTPEYMKRHGMSQFKIEEDVARRQEELEREANAAEAVEHDEDGVVADGGPVLRDQLVSDINAITQLADMDFLLQDETYKQNCNALSDADYQVVADAFNERYSDLQKIAGTKRKVDAHAAA